MREVAAERTKLELIRLCHSSLDSRTLRVELLTCLKSIISFDYAYFSTTDPATQFGTSSVLVEQPPAWLMSTFVENEFLQDDFIKFGDMLRNRQPVGVLSDVTRNELQRSQRYRDMLTPLGMGDELRAVFATDAACWGTLCLHREHAASGYSPAEAAFMAQLTPHIADGLRKALLIDNVSLGKAPDSVGILLLNEDLSIAGLTDAAEYWLMELNTMESGDGRALPLPVRTVVAGLKAIENGVRVVNSTPKVRLRTRRVTG